MTERNLKVIKLVDGEELIAEFLSSDLGASTHDSIAVFKHPMLLDARQIDNKLSIVMVDYVPFTDNKEVTITFDKIITITQASECMVEYYELMLEQLKYSDEAIREAVGKTVKSLRKVLDMYKMSDDADTMLEKIVQTGTKTTSGTKH